MTVFSVNSYKALPSRAAGGSWSYQIICLLALALAAALCTLPPILHNSLPQSQDMIFHVFQAEEFIQNLNNGVLYPRWTAGAINGYGSPNFIFYAPLSYYLAAMIHFIVPSLVSSMVVAIWLGFFLSGAMMFLLASHFIQGYRALVPAILYQILPFHMYEVYVRGSFAALFAYVWFPLILFLLLKIIDDKRPAFPILCLGLTYAALIMTHLVSAYMFSLIIGVILFCFFLKGRFGAVIKGASAFVIGLAFSSIYFIPVFLERKYVHLDYLTNGPWGKYTDNFLFTADKLRMDDSQFSRFYELLHFGIIADLILFGVILFSVRKRPGKPQKALFSMFAYLFLFSFFLTVPLSKPLADILPGLTTLQFPWRWLAIMEVTLAFLSIYMFVGERTAGTSSDVMRKSSFFLVFIVLSAAIVARSNLFGSETLVVFEKPRQHRYKILLGVEYIPMWAHNWSDLSDGPPPEPISFAAGNGTYSIDLWAPQERIFKYASSNPSRIRIATFYYPGWETSLDGRNIPTGLEENSGAILLDVPRGEHIVRLRFVNTPMRIIAQWTSFFTLLFAGILTLALHRKEF